jgi:pimeloyl-ACP methyl ester carboxylesterase
MRLNLFGRKHRLYVEEAGRGTPLLCLHTAGADGRQYRALMNDERVTQSHRVIAFDMPWHGKSSPPSGWHNEEYQLTSAQYTGMILEVMAALELDRPILIGCSIGGRIALHLALEHPERFRAIIGLQAGAHVDPYYDVNFLHRSDVHGGEISAAIVSGLVGPDAPEAERWETLWRIQGRPLFLQDRRRHPWPRQPDRYATMSAVSAFRRIRLFLHAGGNARRCRKHFRLRRHHHEGSRPFSDEREPGRICQISVACVGKDLRLARQLMVKADFFLDLFGNRRSNRLMRMRAGASNDGVFSALKPPS